MRLYVLPLLTLSACIGPAFTTGDDSEPLALETAPPLAVRDSSSSPPEDAGASREAAPEPSEASTLSETSAVAEAAPPANPDAGGCVLFSWAAAVTDGSTQPFGAACMQPDDPAALVPHYYAVVQTNSQGCFLEPTPAACQCATDYSCACLLAQAKAGAGLFCNGAGLVGCDDSSGAPVVTCQ
jgi:hypothetical protein